MVMLRSKYYSECVYLLLIYFSLETGTNRLCLWKVGTQQSSAMACFDLKFNSIVRDDGPSIKIEPSTPTTPKIRQRQQTAQVVVEVMLTP